MRTEGRNALQIEGNGQPNTVELIRQHEVPRCCLPPLRACCPTGLLANQLLYEVTVKGRVSVVYDFVSGNE